MAEPRLELGERGYRRQLIAEARGALEQAAQLRMREGLFALTWAWRAFVGSAAGSVAGDDGVVEAGGGEPA